MILCYILAVKNILFVCTGNTCRSPIAVGLVQKALGKRKDVNVISAGIIASNGLPASPNAIKVMAEEGIDISTYQTKPLTKELVELADIVFVMTQWHKLEVIGILEKPGKEIYLVKEFAPGNPANDDLDIQDPIGKPIDVYRKCRDEIRVCVPGIIKKILEK